jgi:hypothetical protein
MDVEATLEVAVTGPYTATAIAEVATTGPAVLTAINGTTWTLGGVDYEVSDALAVGVVVRDVVILTYKNVSGTLVAVAVEEVPTETFVGKVIAMGSTWQINGNTYTVNGDTMVYDGAAVGDIVDVRYYGANIAVDISPYPTTTVTARLTSVDPVAVEGLVGLTTNEWTDMYDGPVAGDIVKVVYYEYPEGVLVASEISLYAPIKNENSRCTDWQSEDFKIPAGIEKQLPEGVDMAQVYAMFCQGFGWGEIKNAFKMSNDDYTPEELMAMKANGKGWGQLKKELGLTPTHENNGKGHSNDVTSTKSQPENAGKPDKPNNTDHPGNSDHSNNGNNGNNGNNNNNGKANGKNK